MLMQISQWYDNGGMKSIVTQSMRVIREYSGFMLIGAVLGILWANMGHESYEHIKHVELFTNPWIGEPHDGTRVVTVHFFITDIAMAFFFLLMFKEVYEAIVLPEGSLHNPKAAMVPLISTLGGIAGPAVVYVVLTQITGHLEAIRGWAIPTATDIAFSYVIGRMIFGPNHPAIKFLLLLAIADDAGGLAILAIFYPQEQLQLGWLFLSAASVAIGYYILQKQMRVQSFWPYLVVTGGLSFVAFAQAGIHPVLGLLPAVVVMPHAKSDVGMYMTSELERHDTLNEMEHWWKAPVELILCAFAFLNSGVLVSEIGVMTWPVVLALIIGKPVGIFLFGWVSSKFLGLPRGMNYRDLFTLGCVAGIGFTVALFVTTVALPAGDLQDQAKVGALLSFASAIVALIAARVLGVQKHIQYKAPDEMSPVPVH